ncbi:hypothetical protein L1049_020064 [Liquidambar formosana]|uniref:Uncharacterized protein n=1 Tax=Liquidambar formosana TaxID=63359 RepID=A0AAP0X5Q3_LIQFO
MEAVNMEIDGTQELSADPLPFARSYQLDALEKAINQNTIVFLETGSGKTLIAIMLLRSYAYLLRKPSPFHAIFLVPQVVLVSQQAEVVKMHTDLKVGMYWGDMGIDYWDAGRWSEELGKHEVLVMTPAILLNGLRHCFFKLDMIKVLIFDECHHATGRHPYACIMKEFYHRQLQSNSSCLPRILGMTASPVNSKGSNSYWEKIHKLETLMNSKVYTSVSESVLAKFIPFSTTKLKIYKHVEIPHAPYALSEHLAHDLKSLREKHELSLKKLELKESAEESAKKKISKLFKTFLFCLDELGVWLALKAAESIACGETDIFIWGNLDLFGEKIIKDFSNDAAKIFSAYIPSGLKWSIGDNVKANMDAGFLTSKVLCLIESILEYRDLTDLRCIIFVQRIITSIVLQNLLSELLPKLCGWKSKYIAGNNSGLQSQTRKQQNEIVEEFRKGIVNIIVATSILEEGLDVQSCNLVIRFDPSNTVCSFIQSRGRARMQNSVFLLMVRSGDYATLSRVKNYLDCGDMMRKESLRHASLPCESLEKDLTDEDFYCVESTGAIVTLSSSVGLIYFYCSRLPSDGYFRPSPICHIDKDMEICTLRLPKSCPIQTVQVQGNIKMLKQIACLEACKQLHKIGALTDNLVPDMVVEEAVSQEFGNEPYDNEQPSYFPPELVNRYVTESKILYHCYLIELKPNFEYDIHVQNIMLVVRSELESDVRDMKFDFEVGRGNLTVHMKYVGVIFLSPEQVLLCRRFQITVFRVLIDHKLKEVLNGLHLWNDLVIDYLLLPTTNLLENWIIDWNSLTSVFFLCENALKNHRKSCISKGYARHVQTKNGLVCSCMLQNSLVYTPHNDQLYCISGFLDDLDGNSLLSLRDGGAIPYKKYYESRSV